jgi:hypothetical protein
VVKPEIPAPPHTNPKRSPPAVPSEAAGGGGRGDRPLPGLSVPGPARRVRASKGLPPLPALGR